MPTTEEAIQTGEFEGFAFVNDAVYNSDRLYFRNSWQSSLMDSPAHCLHAMTHSKRTDAMDVGRALHCRVLEPTEYEKRFVGKPEFFDDQGKKLHANSTAFKDRFKAWEPSHQGKVVLSLEDYSEVEAIAQKLLSDSEVRNLLRGGKFEHAMFWQDPETGVRCKAKMDIDRLDAGAILDLKKIGKRASLKACRDAVVNYGYHRAAAMYCSGASVLLKHEIKDFILIFIEDEQPYEFRITRVNDAALELGLMEYRKNLSQFKHCQDRGAWPGYPRVINEVDLPSWYWERVKHEGF